MKKPIVLSFLVAFALPAVAQTEDGELPDPSRLIEQNSEFCGYTFFSEGDDTIDLRGDNGRPCFDLKAGRDILAFNPGDFPGGIQVYTGPGRDILVLPDGDDLVIAYDDTDKEYLLGGGNDWVRIPGRLAFGISNPGRGPKTIVDPGSGRDRIEFGDKQLAETVRLRSPDLVIKGDAPGDLHVKSICGRYLDSRHTDVTFPQNHPEKSVKVHAEGCGLMIAEQAGPLDLFQKGGRLGISVVRDEWNEAKAPAKIDAEIEGGTSLSAGFAFVSKESSFSWGGFGPAAVSVAFDGDGTGGKYSLSTSKSIHTSVNLTEGDAEFSVASLEEIELRLVGGLKENEMSFSLMSPMTRISWHPGEGVFPQIKTRGEASVEEVVDKRRAKREDVELELEKEAQMLTEASLRAAEGSSDLPGGEGASEEGTNTEKVNFKNRFFAVQSTLPVSGERVVEGAPVSLAIYREDEEGACFRILVSDKDGVHPEIRAECSEGIFTADVAGYERVEVQSGEEEVSSFDMNGETDFRVKEISFRK